jgi:hypothetical protein
MQVAIPRGWLCIVEPALESVLSADVIPGLPDSADDREHYRSDNTNCTSQHEGEWEDTSSATK